MKQNQGYTLIEVLVALFIFAIASVLIAQGLIQGLSYRKKIHEHSEALVKIQKAMTVAYYDMIQIVSKPALKGNLLRGGLYTLENQLHFTRMGEVNPGFEFQQDSFKTLYYELNEGNWYRKEEVLGSKQGLSQIMLTNVKTMTWTFYDANGRSYDIWPPVQTMQNMLPSMLELVWELNTGERFEQWIPLADYKVSYARPKS